LGAAFGSANNFGTLVTGLATFGAAGLLIGLLLGFGIDFGAAFVAPFCAVIIN
jgi:uncharacterized protein YqgC (DUF456 family)